MVEAGILEFKIFSPDESAGNFFYELNKTLDEFIVKKRLEALAQLNDIPTTTNRNRRVNVQPGQNCSPFHASYSEQQVASASEVTQGLPSYEQLYGDRIPSGNDNRENVVEDDHLDVQPPVGMVQPKPINKY